MKYMKYMIGVMTGINRPVTPQYLAGESVPYGFYQDPLCQVSILSSMPASRLPKYNEAVYILTESELHDLISKKIDSIISE